MLSSEFSFRFVSKKKLLKHSSLEDVSSTVAATAQEDGEESVDTTKRNMLRIAGLAGAGLVASQLIPKQASAYIMGGTPSAGVVGLRDSSNTRIDPATETSLAAVKTQTNKLTFDGSNNLYVQAAANFSSQIENVSGSVVNPATEDTLALIKTQTNKFNFDGSGNLLTSATGGVAGIVGLSDTSSKQVNPASDDAIGYLRRMVKIMESQAAVDSGNRQRITLDSIGTGTAITTTIPVTVSSGTITATVTGATLAAGAAAIGSITAIDGQNHQMFQDFAKAAYASGIRQNLIFS